jgi:hypothetical protein
MAVVFRIVSRIGWRTRVVTAFALALAFIVAFPSLAFANVSLTQISSDPFTAATCTASNTTYHHTEVEPDTFSSGATIVATFQVGRVFDGGSCDIGFATSTNNGGSWTAGCLPGITKFTINVPNCVLTTAGLYDRVSDPAVAFDARHNVWLISSLALLGTSGAAVLTSRSTDGGLTWGNPVTTNLTTGVDKNWIACDNTATSPFYGHCYTEWDNNAAGASSAVSRSSARTAP